MMMMMRMRTNEWRSKNLGVRNQVVCIHATCVLPLMTRLMGEIASEPRGRADRRLRCFRLVLVSYGSHRDDTTCLQAEYFMDRSCTRWSVSMHTFFRVVHLFNYVPYDMAAAIINTYHTVKLRT